MRLPSLLSRIASLHMATICVTSILMPLALYQMLKIEANHLHHRALRDQAAEIARYLRPMPDGRVQLELPPRIRELYSNTYGRYEFAVLDPKGQVIASSLDDDNEPLLPQAAPYEEPVYFVRERGAGAESDSGKSTLWGGSFPQGVGGKVLLVQVSEDIEHRDVLIDDIVDNFFLSVGWITIPILVVLLVIDVAIFRRALRPVVDASALAASIGPRKTNLRLPTERMPREIAPLVTAVNEAFDRLEEGFRLQREFTADAAHELRTPLTVLRTQVDMLDESEVKRSLTGDINAMSRIVNQLLDIAQLELLSIDQAEKADLRAVCSEVAGMIAPLAIAQDKQIAVTGAEGEVWVRGNAEALFQAIRNLAENALFHTPEETAVELHVDPSGKVEVIDAGPGVPEDAQQLIFRRFWRADRRRTEGAGLGLSIVSRIVDAHGGSVTFSNRPAGGAVFSVRLERSVAG